MINYIKRKIERHKLKRTFKEFEHSISVFEIEGFGKIEFAQWLHPFDKPKIVTKSGIEFYKNLTTEGGFIIDIGAHTGDTTVPMALAVGKDGLVLGFEPNKYVHKILEKNASLNTDKTNIIPLCFAATAEDGEFTFNYSDASFCNGGFLSQIKNQSHRHNFTLKVIGKNLENFLLQNYKNELPKLQLVKIDAEGYDKEILKTIPYILKQYKPNLMIECYKKLTQEERNELYDIVDGYGYNLYYLSNFEENGEKHLIKKENMMDNKHFEMLAIPR